MNRSLKIMCAFFGCALIAFAGNAAISYAQSASAVSSPASDETSAAVANTAPPAGSSAPVPVSSAPVPPEVMILKKIEEDLKQKYKNAVYRPPAIASLMFTPSQQSLLREARNGFNTKEPSDSELAAAGIGSVGGDLQRPNLAVRNLSLGGIVFISPDDWTIWLNKKRITADKTPAEAIDLRVYKDFIEIRWFDAETNQIFPIRLRPNQTFSLDAKTFVPG